jgi:hypothetical protein
MFLLHGPRAMFEHAAVPPHSPHGTAVAASLFDQLEVLFDGLQTWHVFAGVVVPTPTKPLFIQHPAWQLPTLQIWPALHVWPLPTCVHAVAVDEGWQIRQGFASLTAKGV